MREIEFRAKRIDNGEWIEGDICHHDGIVSYIGQHPGDGSMITYDLIPETIGQYTGLKDKNGKKIFEGDILSRDCSWSIRIEYEKGSFMVRDLDKVRYNNLICNFPIGDFNISAWEITGNIHDNPELLEV